MSFLPRESDTYMTLHEALEFIDSTSDSDENSSTFSQLEEIEELLGTMTSQSPEEPTNKQENSQATTKKKKRYRNPASSSTVLQRRKRADILTLREEEAELQKLVNHLMNADENSANLKLNAKTYADLKDRKSRLSIWQRSAFEQYELRSKSEKMNRQLKKILSQQRNLSKSLRRIVQKPSLAVDMSYLMRNKSAVHLSEPRAVDDVLRSMAQLENAVNHMYQNSTASFDVSTAPAISSSLQTSYKEQHKGEMVEFITSTPMSCSMGDASNVIWSYLQKEETPASEPNALQKVVTLSVDHHEDTLRFEKLHYIRKFAESDKIALVCSDILLLRSKGLKFCSRGYTTIVPVPSDQLHACVVHSVVQLRIEKDADGAGKEAVFAKDIALGALSKVIRLFWQSEQARLVDEADRVSRESSIFVL